MKPMSIGIPPAMGMPWQMASKHYLQVKLIGDSLNRDGLGAFIELHYDQGKQQAYEYTPYRGYLSTVQSIAHFGLGSTTAIDTLIVKSPNRKMQVLYHVPVDQLLRINIKDAGAPYSMEKERFARTALLEDITDSIGLHFQHEEQDFIDFNIQRLLPHKLSEYGPRWRWGIWTAMGWMISSAAGQPTTVPCSFCNNRMENLSKSHC